MPEEALIPTVLAVGTFLDLAVGWLLVVPQAKPEIRPVLRLAIAGSSLVMLGLAAVIATGMIAA